MGKRDKKQPSVPQTDEKKGYESNFLKNVEWLDEMQDGLYQVMVSGEKFPATHLMKLVLNSANEARLNNDHSVDLSQCYGVKTSAEKFLECCKYEMNNMFAKIWLDRYVQSLSDGLFYTLNTHFMKTSNLTLIADVRHKEARKRAEKIEKDFLTALK